MKTKRLYGFPLTPARPDWGSRNTGCLRFSSDASTESRFSKAGLFLFLLLRYCYLWDVCTSRKMTDMQITKTLPFFQNFKSCCHNRLIHIPAPVIHTHTIDRQIDRFRGFTANAVSTTTKVNCSNYNKHTQSTENKEYIWPLKLNSRPATNPFHPKYPFHMFFSYLCNWVLATVKFQHLID